MIYILCINNWPKHYVDFFGTVLRFSRNSSTKKRKGFNFLMFSVKKGGFGPRLVQKLPLFMRSKIEPIILIPVWVVHLNFS